MNSYDGRQDCMFVTDLKVLFPSSSLSLSLSVFSLHVHFQQTSLSLCHILPLSIESLISKLSPCNCSNSPPPSHIFYSFIQPTSLNFTKFFKFPLYSLHLFVQQFSSNSPSLPAPPSLLSLSVANEEKEASESDRALKTLRPVSTSSNQSHSSNASPTSKRPQNISS